jgi:hypothetical protein
MIRPRPPADMLLAFPYYRPSRELEEWARETFLEPDSELFNEEHRHLEFAALGFLWAAESNSRHGRQIVGQCELGEGNIPGRWRKGRHEQQLREWFGCVPTFVITLDAGYASVCGDAEFCVLVEHELLHAGQQRDEFGQPKFRKSGEPAFAMRGHDVEEFVSIVRRYGVGAGAGDMLALAEAAQARPQIAAASIAEACGTCSGRMVRA